MEDLSIEVYIKKERKYCAGCLHTEDVTRLSKMQYYSWIFTELFTNLYLTEALHDCWICFWCVQRINNAKKLLDNFQAAQNIISKINCIINTSKSHEIIQELCSEITELKKRSMLIYNPLLDTSHTVGSDINSTFSDKYEFKVKNEESDGCSDDKLDADYEIGSDVDFDDNSSDYKVLRSRKCRNIPKAVENVRKRMQENKKVKKHLIKKEKYSKEKDISYSKTKVENSISDELNNADDSKMVVKIELDTEYSVNAYEMEAVVGDPDEIFLMNGKSSVKLEKNNLELERFDAKVRKRHEKQKKRPRNYLPHVKRIPCKECDREFTKEKALQNHMIRTHKKKFPCEKCNRVFIKAEFVKTHMAKVHEPKRGIFECSFCGTIYKNRHKMVQHMNKHEKYGPSLKDLENIVCDHCGKLCDRSNIKKHLIKHSEVKNYHCEFCDVSFKTPEVREEHTRRKHMDPDVGRRFPCPQCPKKFFTSTQVKYHMTAMHFVQGKPCPVCSKCFATKSKVREHILRVHDKVPAVRDKQCDFCDKAFSTRRQLKHHRYTHTGEKPYKCDLCTSAYNQKHCLSVHKLRAHNVDTPKTMIKNISNATVANSHTTRELRDDSVSWYPSNLSEGRQVLFNGQSSE